jgi:hypothetical protein
MKAADIIRAAESTLSVDAIKAMPTEDVEQLECFFYHWQSVVASVLRARIAASKDEEPE